MGANRLCKSYENQKGTLLLLLYIGLKGGEVRDGGRKSICLLFRKPPLLVLLYYF